MRNRTCGFAIFLSLLAASLILISPPSLIAQDATGIVLGTISDPQGSVLPDAKVTVVNTGTQQSVTVKTGADGSFRIPNLPIGNYTVAAEHTGFAKMQTKEQKLQINQSLRFDIKLQVGSTETTIEVSTDAAQVETVNSTIGNSVTSRPLVDLPLNGRNVLQLALLQPGVTEENPDNGAAGTFSIAGGRTDSVTYLLDGGINNNLLNNGVVFTPNPDTVAEFRILQNNYTAEYGRNGGGVVSVVTKSGTNNWHGSLFEFIRNDALNANSYFNKMDGLPRDVLKRNQFGGTVGGPIIKNKLFFFLGYQGTRLAQTVPSYGATAFTQANLQNGDFSQADPDTRSYVESLLTPLGDPNCDTLDYGCYGLTYYMAPGHTPSDAMLDPKKFDPVARNYIAAGLLPISSSPDGLLNSYGKGSNYQDELTMKTDYTISENDRLSVTIGGNLSTTVSPFVFANVNGYPNIDKGRSYFGNLTYTHTFSPTVLNEFRFTAQRIHNLQRYVGSHLPTAAELGVGVTPDQPTGPPNLWFDNNLYTGFSEQGPTNLVNNTFSYQDVFSWVKGAHTWKFGGGFTPYQNNTVYDFYINGEFDFSFLPDFLIGNPYYLYQYPMAPSNIRQKQTYVFAQDEWHIGRHLVLNLGVRYEYSTPKEDTQGRSFSYIPGLQSTVFPGAPQGLVFPGDKGAPTGANFPDRNDFAPRFGFAWDPFGTGRTSIRGGIGVFYDILKGEDNLQFNGQPPFFASVGIGSFTPLNGPMNYLSDPFGSTGSVNPFPSKPVDYNVNFADAGFLPINAGQAIYLVNPHLRTPYTYQYNLNIQQQLADNTVFELAYVGSQSRKLTSLMDLNPMNAATGVRVINEIPALAGCNESSPWGNCYSFLPEFNNVVNQSYNALEVSATRQLSETGKLGKTYFTFAYTWSHNIDNSSGFRERNSQVPAWNTGYFRASSDMDVRHRITFSGGWDMPLDRWTGANNRLTNGWSWYPILTWRTGFPFDIPARFGDRWDDTAISPSGYGDGYLAYANAVGPTNTGLNIQPGAVYWFNPDSFSRACEYVSASCPNGYGSPYGTTTRNSLRGPGRTNFDLALAKVTKITENTSLQFRAEAFNILNHAEFSTPVVNIRSQQFGQITDTADPRILQFALRFQF